MSERKFDNAIVSGNKHLSVALHQNHAIVFIEMIEIKAKC